MVPSTLSPLPVSFFEVTPIKLAKKLLGTVIVRQLNDRTLTARIVETEAYGGCDDPASHAYRGMTVRNTVMFNSGGYAYVYFTYGMHFCFNVVAGRAKKPGAVLIRAAEPLDGIDVMMKNRNKEHLHDLLSGPAKLCQALAIDGSLNGLALNKPPVYISRGMQDRPVIIRASGRIGIKAGVDKKWRFFDSESDFVSVR